MVSTLKTIETTIMNLILKGVDKIKKASMSYVKTIVEHEDGEFIEKPQWVIDTTGSNLNEILGNENIDPYRTISNNIVEIYETFGIEAVRNLLLQEILDVIEYSGAYVNYRHVALLADTMTNKGFLMSIDRFGINKSDRGPLAKCSFEETPDILAKAALFGELDHINGVSSNIMMGQEVPIGTGCVDLFFDEEAFMNNHISNVKKVEQETKYSEEYVENYCTEDNLQFNMVNIDTISEDQLNEAIPEPEIVF